MKNKLITKSIIFFSMAFLALSSCSKNWSYEGSSSPEFWHKINKEYKFCKIGYNQSPIDIVNQKFNKIDFEIINNKNTVIKANKEHNFIKLNIEDGSKIKFRNKIYKAKNIIFHHPSEHFINNQQYSLEMQISYKSEDEQYFQLAIFLELDKKNHQIDNKNLEPIINIIENQKKQLNEYKINLGNLINLKDTTFAYEGSLTTPPCTESVKWRIFRKPIIISKNQMNKIIKLALFNKSNNRPLQKFNPSQY
ncbi:MAG: carbonic anhydrase family protein [Rickettsiales bacterium]|jgi:carbonic anhydrase|nr:carbonic anhydrase family protein [Rickettsiales bacterium]